MTGYVGYPDPSGTDTSHLPAPYENREKGLTPRSPSEAWPDRIASSKIQDQGRRETRMTGYVGYPDPSGTDTSHLPAPYENREKGLTPRSPSGRPRSPSEAWPDRIASSKIQDQGRRETRMTGYVGYPDPSGTDTSHLPAPYENREKGLTP